MYEVFFPMSQTVRERSQESYGGDGGGGGGMD